MLVLFLLQERRRRLGDYDGEEAMSDDVERVLKDPESFEDGRRYYGFW